MTPSSTSTSYRHDPITTSFPSQRNAHKSSYSTAHNFFHQQHQQQQQLPLQRAPQQQQTRAGLSSLFTSTMPLHETTYMPSMRAPVAGRPQPPAPHHAYSQGPCPPLPPPSPPADIPWRPPQTLHDMERPKFSATALAGKQMLPLEPRSIFDPTLDESTTTPMAQFSSIIEFLRFRGLTTPEKSAFSALDNKGQDIAAMPTGSWTWEEIYGRAEKISQTILNKTQLRQGARVALVFRKSEILDFMAAFYGCIMAGMTAVPINVIEEFAEMIYILAYTKAELALTTEYNYRALTRDLSTHKGMDWPAEVTWWKTDTLGSSWRPKKKKVPTEAWAHMELILPDVAYIEYTKSPNGELKGVAVSHRTIISQCHAIKHTLGSNPRRASVQTPSVSTTTETMIATAQAVIGGSGGRMEEQQSSDSLPAELADKDSMIAPSETARSDVTMSWLEPRQQVGLVLGGLLGVYRGSHTVFLHSGVMETTGLWEECAQRHRVTLAVGDYEGVRKMVQLSKPPKAHSCSLPFLETFLIDAVAVQPLLDQKFANKFLAPLGVIEAQKVVVPISSLPEHGGMILSMRDDLMFPRGADQIDFGFEYAVPRKPALGASIEVISGNSRPRGHSPDSDTICHYLLDRAALTSNTIRVVASGEEAIQRAMERGVVLVGAFGYATPKGILAIVDPETMALCQLNRVGEIWVNSPSIAFGFWELPGHSQSIFHALPLIVPIDTMVPEVYDPVPTGFLRTGLMGGLIEGRVVVFGLYEDRIQQEALQDGAVNGAQDIVGRYEYHYTADLSCTIMERIMGFTACVTFECCINGERLPVVCAETARYLRADLTKLSGFIKCAMEDYHGLRPYCIAIAQSGSLPRAYKNGKRVVHPVLCRMMLELGRLPLSHLWTSVDNTVFNFPVGVDIAGGIWGPEALLAREQALPVHVRMVQFSCCEYPLEVLDEQSKINLSQFASLAELLVWRSIMNPDEIAFLDVDHQGNDSKAITFRKFGMKVVSIANFIEKKGGFKAGDRVVLLFPNGTDFAATMYATWMLGLVPVPVMVPDPSKLHEDIVMLMGLLTELRVSHLIGNSVTEEVMKQKTTMIHIKACIGARQDAAVPIVLNISKASKVNKSLGKESGYSAPPRASLAKTAPAVIQAHYSTDMRRTLIKVTHASLLAQCRAQKIQCRHKNGKPIVSCWKSFVGLGLLQSCGLGVYVGAPTVLIRYTDFMAAPQIYFEAIERHGAKDALINYAMLEQALAAWDPQSPSPSYDFSAVRNFLISAEERPRAEVHQALERRLCGSLSRESSSTSSAFHMERAQICGMFGHMTNPLVTTRSYMNIKPVRLYLSLKSLRHGVVDITTEEEDPTGIWVEDSGIPVCGTTVAIVNPETREVCLSREIGEIWVSSEANVQAYASTVSPLVVEADPHSAMDINASRFNATIMDETGSTASTLNSVGMGLGVGGLASGGFGLGGSRSSATSFVRTGEIGFLWNYANENFNGGRATSLLFVLGAIGETFEVNGLMHFPQDVEATIEKAHPNIASSGSIVFQADQAVVCVVQVRHHDASTINLILSVMHQVLEKHQFMPDVIAIVGEGVLAKSRYGEKQRGKMLSLFLSAKMPLLHIHYPHGALPQSMPEQLHPQEEHLHQPMAGFTARFNSSSTADSSPPSSSYTARSSTPSSSCSSSKSVSPAAGPVGKKSGSMCSGRSEVSMVASFRSVRFVKSFVGSVLNHVKRGDSKKAPGVVARAGRSSSVLSRKGIDGSWSESGLASLSTTASRSGSLSKMDTTPPPAQPITIYATHLSGKKMSMMTPLTPISP